MKRKIVTLAALSVGCTALVIFLYFVSAKVNYRDGSFVRLFPPHPIKVAKNFDLKYNSYYFAGATTHTVYLANYKSPFHVIALSRDLQDSSRIDIVVENLDGLQLSRVMVEVDSPYVYLMDGIRPAYLRAHLSNRIARPYLPDSVFFTDAVVMGAKSVAFRAVNHESRNVLGKLTDQPPYFDLESNILKKQVDGIFCTDGMLHFNRDKNMLIYLYYYRNEYICMDTNLHVLRTGRTIDTTTHAKIQVTTVSSKKPPSMSAPAHLVNKRSCSSGDFLFVNSNLLASNENRDLFDVGAVIDVYSTSESQYKFSFYLFNQGKYRMQSFRVYGDRLFALYDNWIVSYDLVPKFFKD